MEQLIEQDTHVAVDTIHASHRAPSAGAYHSLELLIVWDGFVNMKFTFVMGM
jgi:hypothetical protein